ncbi:MAG: hypothetical protein HY042_02705 [Spirochaetia bacterium]|nr:hypothetical protein [Spirochaetia bacterium]
MGDEKLMRELLGAVERLTVLLQNQPKPATHPAAEIILTIIPLVAIVLGSVLLFFFLLWQYRLKGELIRTNQFVYTSWKNIRILSLLAGCISTLVGVPITVLFLVVEGVNYHALGGIIPLFAGIGLLLFYGLSRGITHS